jgi:hypothetical protein
MKKSTLPILALIVAMLLAACGNKDEGEAVVLETPAPILTEEVNAVVAEEVDGVSVIELTGTVNIERMSSDAPSLDEDPSIINARAGMRLMNRDTLRTFAESAAWLLLEEERAVELGELTALHIDRQDKGFVLTLSEGAVTAQIDSPLGESEELAVMAGDLVLAVRGTIFTVRIAGAVVTVSVERGEVAVIDSNGTEIATVKAGEVTSFDTGNGNMVVATPAQSAADGYEAGKIVEFGGYEWRVLEVKDGKALLLSEYVLESRTYHGEWYEDWFEEETWEEHAVTWAECDLRIYLNGEFYNSFSENERARIYEVYLPNIDNPWYGASGGSDTNDRIFLLSIDEAVKYFGDSGQLSNRPSRDTRYIDDEYNEARTAGSTVDLAYTAFDGGANIIEAGTAASWWLRSPGYSNSLAVMVIGDGRIAISGTGIGNDFGVRPALWINL